MASLIAAALLGADGQGCAGGRTVGTAACLGCHDGRTAQDVRGWAFGLHGEIDCEHCHGPGEAHVRNVGRGGLFITNPADLTYRASMQVCSECHAEYHAGYLESPHGVPGSITCHDCHDVHLEGGMRFPSENGTRLSRIGFSRACGDCHPAQVASDAHSLHAAVDIATCYACHELHAASAFVQPFETNAACLQCHASMALGFNNTAVIDAHTGPFHPVDPAGSGASRCTGCHMPPLEAAPGAPHDHSMATIAPATSNEAIDAGFPPSPNSCAGVTGCHDAAVEGSGVPHDLNDRASNSLLQALYESIGAAP